MPRRPSQEKQTRRKRTPLPPSMLDQMQAMLRHPECQRLLPLWQSIYSKNYVGLTAEEEQERDTVPRTRFQVAAMMEADIQWLSRSIQDINHRADKLRRKASHKPINRQHKDRQSEPDKYTEPTDAIWTKAEAQWAHWAISLPFGDDSNAVAPLLLADLSSDYSLQYVKETIDQHRKQTGLKPIQFPRRPSIDPWKIYDMMQKSGATLPKVRDQIFGPYDSRDRRYKTQKPPRPARVKARVKADLKKVQTAYRYALKVLNSLNIR